MVLGRQLIDVTHSLLFWRRIQEFVRVEDDSGAPGEHCAIRLEDEWAVEPEVEEHFGLGIHDCILDGMSI